MKDHRHSPRDPWSDATQCLRCGRDIVRIVAGPDRMAYWRAVRRVRRPSARSVVPTPARLDNTDWSEAELREAYGR